MVGDGRRCRMSAGFARESIDSPNNASGGARVRRPVPGFLGTSVFVVHQGLTLGGGADEVKTEGRRRAMPESMRTRSAVALAGPMLGLVVTLLMGAASPAFGQCNVQTPIAPNGTAT